ncbi:hypothetical protein FRC08_005235 [Ceratobasidium sp. 394]|nr:hypothetical protein FRC08_005235 [Ceratobasidium sp. 394]KAG9100882.1 hypothetical protein FS749_012202 [Ceratobasidium sp. UAMH 11750]
MRANDKRRDAKQMTEIGEIVAARQGVGGELQYRCKAVAAIHCAAIDSSAGGADNDKKKNVRKI